MKINRLKNNYSLVIGLLLGILMLVGCAEHDNRVLSLNPLLRPFTKAKIPSASHPAKLYEDFQASTSQAFNLALIALKKNRGNIIFQDSDFGLITVKLMRTHYGTFYFQKGEDDSVTSCRIFFQLWHKSLPSGSKFEQQWFTDILKDMEKQRKLMRGKLISMSLS